jgi:hypothetical protein
MKLKDLLNKKKEVIKEDVSTMKIKSNIAQTWKDERNVEEDLIAWFDGAVGAGGTGLGDDIIYAVEDALERMRKINDAYKI